MQQLLHRGAAVTQHRTDEVLDASWDDLKSFLVCAKHKSFRNAAEVLALTSTTLMRRIDRLEERIGCKLFLRDQSGLTLSEEGLAMIADVTEMERHAFNISRRAHQSSNDPAGTVRVAVTEGPGNFWISSKADRLPENLSQDHGRSSLRDGAGGRRAAGSDIAIQLEPPTNPDLIVAKLGRLHIYPFVSEGYRNYGTPASLDDLQEPQNYQQNAPQVDDSAYARILGLTSLEGVVGIKTTPASACCMRWKEAQAWVSCRLRRSPWVRRWSLSIWASAIRPTFGLPITRSFATRIGTRSSLTGSRRYSTPKPTPASGMNSFTPTRWCR
jgi:DNA-binding transcriptional LysR family regulator